MGPSVTAAQARAFVLAKQGLAGPGAGAVIEATLGTAGVPSIAPTCYLAYAARVSDFQFHQLDERLYLDKRLVRVSGMRGGVYIEPLELAPVVLAATRKRADRNRTPELAERIESLLEAHGPQTIADLRALLGAEAPRRKRTLEQAVDALLRKARLVRAHARSPAGDDDFTYARWVDWIGAPARDVDPAEARVELAHRYLRAFGPATPADLKWWAGWTVKETTSALDALGKNAVRVSVDRQEGAYVLTDELLLLGVTDPAEVRSVRLLPVHDPYLMGWADTTHIVGDDDHGRIYDLAGNATSVVVIDGAAAGVWELDEVAHASGRCLTVRIAGFRPEMDDRWQEVVDAAARVGFAIRADELRIERIPAPPPLAEGKRNAYLAPIRMTMKDP